MLLIRALRHWAAREERSVPAHGIVAYSPKRVFSLLHYALIVATLGIANGCGIAQAQALLRCSLHRTARLNLDRCPGRRSNLNGISLRVFLRSDLGDVPVNRGPQYNRRAMECLAYAEKAPNEEERNTFLAMAETLTRIAAERERPSAKTYPSEASAPSRTAR